MAERILVRLDGSALAELALKEAFHVAKLSGASVILLHVVAPIEEVIASDGDVFTIDQQWESRRIHGLQYLKSICSRPEWRDVGTSVAVEMGNTAEVILDFARKNDVSRIVMSTHGRSGLSRWVYGSVADKVLRAADRTTVLVRAGAEPGASSKSGANHKEIDGKVKANV